MARSAAAEDKINLSCWTTWDAAAREACREDLATTSITAVNGFISHTHCTSVDSDKEKHSAESALHNDFILALLHVLRLFVSVPLAAEEQSHDIVSRDDAPFLYNSAVIYSAVPVVSKHFGTAGDCGRSFQGGQRTILPPPPANNSKFQLLPLFTNSPSKQSLRSNSSAPFFCVCTNLVYVPQIFRTAPFTPSQLP